MIVWVPVRVATMLYFDQTSESLLSEEELMRQIADEELIADLLNESKAIRTDAESIRERANAIVRRIEQSGRDIGREEQHDND